MKYYLVILMIAVFFIWNAVIDRVMRGDLTYFIFYSEVPLALITLIIAPFVKRWEESWEK